MPRRQSKKRKGNHPLCVGCATNLQQSSYIKIKPEDGVASSCNHVHCMQCFGSAHASRSSDLRINCQSESCNRISGTWHVHSYNGTHHLEPVVQQTTLPIDERHKRKHPTLFFSCNESEFRQDNAILSLSVMNPFKYLY